MQMAVRIFAVLGLTGLAACAPPVPDSAADVDGAFVGPAAPGAPASAIPDSALTGPVPAEQGAPDIPTRTPDGDEITARARAALDQADAGGQTAGTPPAADGNTLPDEPGTETVPSTVENDLGISQENDFEAVDAQRDIEDDASRIARNRERYTMVAPEDLPQRPGDTGPNIVAYALATDHPVGTQMYRRVGIGLESRNERNCAEFTSPDLAQAEFLRRGGPERDPKALDPDGDGYACGWDPAAYRAVRGGN